jgi:hypothetical protein
MLDNSKNNNGGFDIGEQLLKDDPGLSTSVYKLSTDRPQMSTSVYRHKNTEQRDRVITQVANALIRGRCSQAVYRPLLENIIDQCEPKFEVETKFVADSFINQALAGERNISAKVREVVLEQITGIFLSTDVYNCLQVSTRDEKKNVSIALKRLCEEKIIEKHGDRNGVWQKLNKDLIEVDIFDVSVKPVRPWLPLNLDKMVDIYPGDIITFQGRQNAGKSAFAMNCAAFNRDDFKVTYFTSESGNYEFRRRADLYTEHHGMPIEEWRKIKIYDRSCDFHQVIPSGKGNLIIIDYLQVTKDFFMVGEFIRQIWEKLDGAICIICLQKDGIKEEARGGYSALDKPRLSINIDPGVCMIRKAKNRSEEFAKNSLDFWVRDFNLIGGCKIWAKGEWRPRERRGAN